MSVYSKNKSSPEFRRIEGIGITQKVTSRTNKPHTQDIAYFGKSGELTKVKSINWGGVRAKKSGRQQVLHDLTTTIQLRKWRFIEKLGWYDPRGKKVEVDEDKVLSWVSKGVKISNYVKKLLLNFAIVSSKELD